jgi:pimeloyl-ACP methyl ester carboxylesterase
VSAPSRVVFDSVELDLGRGLTGFGELCLTNSPLNALCVMLHDTGEDLDSLRWLALMLIAEGISVLLIDLPGHGLSGGNLRDDLAAVLASTYAIAESQGCAGVCFVAKGATSHALLLSEQLAPPIATVLVSPIAASGGGPVQHGSWERVPKLALIPTGSAISAEFADAVVRETHAWCLRTSLAFDPQSDPLQPAAQTQIGSITAKFLLEQIAFAMAAQSERLNSAQSLEAGVDAPSES